MILFCHNVRLLIAAIKENSLVWCINDYRKQIQFFFLCVVVFCIISWNGLYVFIWLPFRCLYFRFVVNVLLFQQCCRMAYSLIYFISCMILTGNYMNLALEHYVMQMSCIKRYALCTLMYKTVPIKMLLTQYLNIILFMM